MRHRRGFASPPRAAARRWSCHASRSRALPISIGPDFGHHFSPAIEAVPEAILRSGDVVEELEFWPQCPQFWELASEQGTTYRYCAHASAKPAEVPPRPCS